MKVIDSNNLTVLESIHIDCSVFSGDVCFQIEDGRKFALNTTKSKSKQDKESVCIAAIKHEEYLIAVIQNGNSYFVYLRQNSSENELQLYKMEIMKPFELTQRNFSVICFHEFVVMNYETYFLNIYTDEYTIKFDRQTKKCMVTCEGIDIYKSGETATRKKLTIFEQNKLVNSVDCIFIDKSKTSRDLLLYIFSCMPEKQYD